MGWERKALPLGYRDSPGELQTRFLFFATNLSVYLQGFVARTNSEVAVKYSLHAGV